MTEYDISGDIVTISTEVENECYVKRNTTKLINQVGKMFDSWYASQSNCERVYTNASDILCKAVQPIIKKGVEMLNAQGVYSLDEHIFSDKYLKGFADEYYNTLDSMMDKIAEIEEQKQQENAYRQVRKANRGRVVGGGFGLGGAIKGMATAGMINATTGIAHSLGNAVGNMGSSIAASANMTTVYKNFKEPLRSAILKSSYNVRNGIRDALEREVQVKCKYVTVTECDRAEAILKNYQQGRIPSEQKKRQIMEALLLNPYAFEIYEAIWKDYGDKNGDLRKMSAYFGVTLEQRIKNIAEDYGNSIFSKNCKVYENALDKKTAAILCESQIKETLETLIQYCNEHDISEDTITMIDRCQNLLKDVDVELRTVKGSVYETRELANNVRKDFEHFYSVLAGKNIVEGKLYEYVKESEFVTKEFKEKLNSLFEAECGLRTPQKVYENIYAVVNQTLVESIENDNWVEVPNYIGKFQQKESMVRTITSMQNEEVALILLNNSANGKSGILLTNFYFRIYSKGIFSNESQLFPIEKVNGIEYLGNDGFMVSICEQEPVKFVLKLPNKTTEEKIAISKMINEIVVLINNIYPQSRLQLFRILNGNVVCECGIHLLSGEKICPICNRMLRDTGEFVETKRCPNCRNLIPFDKKFCYLCGSSVLSDNNILVEHKVELIEPVKEKNISSEEGAVQEIRCSECKNLIKAGKKFCSICGRKVQ